MKVAAVGIRFWRGGELLSAYRSHPPHAQIRFRIPTNGNKPALHTPVMAVPIRKTDDDTPELPPPCRTSAAEHPVRPAACDSFPGDCLCL